ncbi:SHOCT domain-containing protein [Rhizobium laguerreae]|uniref:SHOCT domain-containing protein n=1 Tax=Rhizobium laguerreae TaxID=1076926 RepID=UPI001C8FAD05|nr:SHOCT domain-containing protein [Rhizobium laguerreae]MBY3211502.1 SHOCT domain-containing protein [Rhizobium laguerreae]
MNDDSKSLAELAAMKARGELTTEQFEDARKLLASLPGSSEQPRPQPPTPQKPKKKGGCRKFFLGLLIILGGLWALGSYLESQKTPEQRAQESADRAAADAKAKQEAAVAKQQAAVKAAAENAEQAERRRKGFHCLSGWDGSNRALVDAVTKSLRDPSSFEHDETRISPVNPQGQHFVVMTFRAKNGFGGTNVGSATGMIRQSDCSLVSWELVSS